MNENTVVITESGGKYQIKNNGISEFALLGILECIVFEMKSANRQESPKEEVVSSVLPEAVKKQQDTAPITQPEPIAPKPDAPDLRTRIGNAVKAIKSLGGEATDFDADNATDEELQEELNALTEQYKRLKSSKKLFGKEK